MFASEALSSHPVFSGTRNVQSLPLVFVDNCLSFYQFPVGPCIVGPSSTYGF